MVVPALETRAAELIQELKLEPHPEGGFYREVYKSPIAVSMGDDRKSRMALTAIYFLLPSGHFSRWHRVRSDEIWTYVEGGPVSLHLFDGSRVWTKTVAPFSSQSEPLAAVPAGTWQAAEAPGGYVLAACFVAPGFEFADLKMLNADPEIWKALSTAAPTMVDFI